MRGGYGPDMRGGYGGGNSASLNLTAKQQQALNKLWQRTTDRQQELRGQLYEDGEQLRALMAKPSPDPKAVGQAYDKVAATRRKLLTDQVQVRKQYDAILTPEQRKAWNQSRGWFNNGSPSLETGGD